MILKHIASILFHFSSNLNFYKKNFHFSFSSLQNIHLATKEQIMYGSFPLHSLLLPLNNLIEILNFFK